MSEFDYQYSRVHSGQSNKNQTIYQNTNIDDLRKQYEILRDIPVNMMSKKQLNDGGSLLSYSLSKKSQSSSSNFSRNAFIGNNNNHIWMLQKQQLEMVISNSMKKIQQLLSKQVNYKKMIHQLEMEKQKYLYNNQIEELTQALEQIKKQQFLLLELNAELQRNYSRVQKQNSEQIDKNMIIQKKLKINESQNSQLRYQIDSLQKQVNNHKVRYSDLEIEMTRLRRQCQISVKNYEDQIQRYERQPTIHHMPDNRQLIRQFEEKLGYQREKYEHLQKELKSYQNRLQQINTQSPSKQAPDNSIVWDMLKKVRDQSNNNRENSVLTFSQTLNQLLVARDEPELPKENHNSAETLLQIFLLRKEIEKLRQTQKPKEKAIKPKNNDFEFLQKIKQLQQKIKKSDSKTSKLTTDNQELQKKYQVLSNQFQAIKMQCQLLRTQVNSNILQNRQVQELKQRNRQKFNQYQIRCDSLRKNIDNLTFQLKKQKQTHDFEINMKSKCHESELTILQRQLTKGQRDRSMLGQQLQKMKIYYDGKILDKNEQIQKIRNQYRFQLQNNQKALISLKNSNQHQISQLISKIKQTNRLNDRCMSLVTRNSELQRQVSDMKQMLPQLRGLNANVEHLWIIKQTQYQNLNAIVREILSHQ